MGTRHLIAVQLDGELRVAQYGQWDGCPEGHGSDLVGILKGVDHEELKRKIRASTWATYDEITEAYKKAGHDGSQWVSLDVQQKFEEMMPALNRNLGAKVLRIIMESPDGIKLRDAKGFAGECVFCEWAYVVDFDNGMLEVFKGFQKRPTTGERFSDVESRDAGYFPVALVKKYPIASLPEPKVFGKMAEDDARAKFGGDGA